MERARRIIGTVVIHSVPLCGSASFETVESVGSCIRAYITIPAMLADGVGVFIASLGTEA